MQIVSRIYDDYTQAKHVVRDLEDAGFPQSNISIIGREVAEHDTNAGEGAAAGAGLGAAVGGAGGLLAGLGLVAIPGLGPVVAAGWLAATLTGAVAGAAVGGAAGGLIGSFTHAGINEDEAHVYAEAVRRGSTVVSVQVEEHEVLRVREIMNKPSSVDVENRREYYRQQGWVGFDPESPEYTKEQIDEERARIHSNLNV